MFFAERPESGFCDEEVTEYSIVPRLKAFSDWILKAMALGNLEDIFPAASREYAPLVEELWKDPAIQATYRRRNELPFLPSAASYFLDRVLLLFSWKICSFTWFDVFISIPILDFFSSDLVVQLWSFILWPLCIWNDQVVDISRTEYELCDIDILYADGITSSDGLASTDISFPQLALDVRVADELYPQDTLLR